MWRERLIRFLLVGLGAVLILGAARSLADWRARKSPTLPKLSVEKLQSEGVLGVAKQKILRRKQADQVIQEEPETEPIAEPAEKVEKQTKDLIETIKQLPQDQMEAIKKQLFKEFCEQFLAEEE